MSRAERAFTESHLYRVQITRRDGRSVSAYVTRADRRYGVTLSTDGVIACSCPDAMHRDVICKHAHLVLAEVSK